MDYATYVEHVRQDGQRLGAAASGSLSNEVPSCPGWTVSDLVSHVAEVYEQLGRLLEEQGRRDEALELFKRALAARQRVKTTD